MASTNLLNNSQSIVYGLKILILLYRYRLYKTGTVRSHQSDEFAGLSSRCRCEIILSISLKQPGADTGDHHRQNQWHYWHKIPYHRQAGRHS